MTTLSTQSDVDQIRRRMAQIRCDLHEDMQEVVSGAEVAFDWRHYVRQYPWIAIGAATAVGYLVVPKRRKVVVEADQAVNELRKVASAEAERVHTKSRRKGWVRTALGLATPLLVRAGQRYAMGLAENWLAQQQAEAAPRAESSVPPDGGARPGPTGPRRS